MHSLDAHASGKVPRCFITHALATRDASPIVRKARKAEAADRRTTGIGDRLTSALHERVRAGFGAGPTRPRTRELAQALREVETGDLDRRAAAMIDKERDLAPFSDQQAVLHCQDTEGSAPVVDL